VNHLASLRTALETALPFGSSSRREFMALSGSALSGAWLMGLLSGCEAAGSYAATAMLGGEELRTFTEREGRDFEAFSALMIPTDDTPGAREAGTVYFADQALASFFDFLLSTIRPGLADLSERANAVEPSADGFASLDEEAQLGIVRTVETEAAGFFETARLLVMLGFASHPSYGGNRDKVGWQVLGFEDRFQYTPPFGAYDAPIHEGGAS
jgi:gluconate 2-dehydrogenase gamma chain